MDMSHIHEDDLVLHYYGEMADAEEARLAAHLASCAGCTDAYRRLQRVLGAVDAGVTVDAPENFERLAWARLEPNLERSARGRGWRGWLLLAPAPLALAAAVIVLVAGAFFAGRLFPRGGDGPAEASAQTVRERILLVNLGDHLDRSQMVLVEMVAADGNGVARRVRAPRGGSAPRRP